MAAQDTDQTQFWRGDFGNNYTVRNSENAENLNSQIELWKTILESLSGDPPQSILEVGANTGNNLRAIRSLSKAELFALEPNKMARQMLAKTGTVPLQNVLNGVATSIDLANESIDLAFTSGVLIHIHPNNLKESCQEIYRVAARFIVCIEYFSDTPEEITYRGHNEKLFKRDFGGYWLDLFPEMKTLKYGFIWKRLSGLDNLTWWVFQK